MRGSGNTTTGAVTSVTGRPEAPHVLLHMGHLRRVGVCVLVVLKGSISTTKYYGDCFIKLDHFI